GIGDFSEKYTAGGFNPSLVVHLLVVHCAELYGAYSSSGLRLLSEELAERIHSQGYDFWMHVFNGHGFNFDPLKSFCSWLANDVDDDNKKSVLDYVLRLDLDKLFAVYFCYVPNVTKLQACAALDLYEPLGLYLELDLQRLWREICTLYKAWDDTLTEELVQRLRTWATP
ncbi:hypothetical protein FOL47_002176, partial [Perkinsus chesapeaki]